MLVTQSPLERVWNRASLGFSLIYQVLESTVRLKLFGWDFWEPSGSGGSGRGWFIVSQGLTDSGTSGSCRELSFDKVTNWTQFLKGGFNVGGSLVASSLVELCRLVFGNFRVLGDSGIDFFLVAAVDVRNGKQGYNCDGDQSEQGQPRSELVQDIGDTSSFQSGLDVVSVDDFLKLFFSLLVEASN